MQNNKGCVICSKALELEETVVLSNKRAETINKCSTSRHRDIAATAGSNVHVTCRKRYTDTRDIEKSNKELSDSSTITMRSRRKSNGSYDLKIDCLFCETPVDWSRKHCRWNEPIQVRTIELTDNVKKGCKKRCDE